MSGHIPEHILDEILSRIDIVELISSYIPLKKIGRSFKALCPFHHEKTPSFIVSADKQIYHCFGCSAGGNAFNFLMQYERMEFPEAAKTLAQKAGVTLPEEHKQDVKAAGLTTQIYKINELAASYYEQCLKAPEGRHAAAYLLKRGLKQKTLDLFKLGYALNKWDALIASLRAHRVPLSLMEKAGLVLSKEGGGYYDRFRDRVIFPIFDIKSRPIAFGARMLPSEGLKSDGLPQAKYINSPETAVYSKGKNLFGLHLAKDAIRDKDCAVVVEGYLDCIVPYQEGLHNIVASSGTALTLEQIRLIKRYTHNVVMVYDADMAGQMATLRSLDMFIEESMNVRVASLAPGSDPDVCVRKEGIDRFTERVAGAKDLFDYKMNILKSQYDSRSVEGKAKISSEMLATINRFQNAIYRSEYLKKLAQELRVEEGALLQEMQKLKNPALLRDGAVAEAKAAQEEKHPTERLLLKLMLEESALINRVRESLKPDDFQDTMVSKMVSLLFRFLEEGKQIEMSCLLNHIGSDEVSRFVCESACLSEPESQHKDKIIEDCIKRLQQKSLTSKKQCLHKEIKVAQQSGDEALLSRLVAEFNHLLKKR